MRIIELIIDGFKSYAVRTVISGWDDSFNSITGLNGSGKSNILDSICFVLGITNMSTVRAQNLQDLIYKRGQAGVTKASVTIVFDNKDKKKSPIGFEECDQISVTRQIVLGGTSKYLINGHRAQQHTVQNLFQSVQLNINNPNFLIMQGRITKVLNMKPVEILAMIEEAAGTRMFEDRRDKAFKTMAKKELKVQELTELLKDEIDPKLERLRQEKRAFLDFQQTQNDLERMTKLVVAYDYLRLRDKAKQAVDHLEDKKQLITRLEDSEAKLKNEIGYLRQDLEKVKTERDRELRKGGTFQALEDKVKEYSHEVVRMTTLIDLKTTSVAEEAERRTSMMKNAKEFEKQSVVKQRIFQALEENYRLANVALTKQQEEVASTEELLQTLQTGVATREGQEGGYQGQLQAARARQSQATTEQEQCKLKIEQLENQVKEEEPRAKKAKEQNAGLLKNLERLKLQARQLEDKLRKTGYSESKLEGWSKDEANFQQQIRKLKEDSEAVRRKAANLDFTYSDPSSNFDRNRVKGLVAQLFTLDKSQAKAATALEICAGGRLYNVVVDTAETGSQLLQNGRLRKRVTIIPLNKIAVAKSSKDKVSAAQSLAPGKVDLALTLVGYEEEVTAAMEYVFGSTLVCADAQTAKTVTFDPSVKMKSVTLEGDVYDPAGTLSGGSALQSNGVLLSLQRLNELTKELTIQEHGLAELQAKITSEMQNMSTARQIKQELDLKSHEIGLTEQQISGNAASSIIQKVEQMNADIIRCKQGIVDAKSKHEEASKDVKRIEKEMADFGKNKGGKLAEIESSLEKLKAALRKSLEAIKPLQQEKREAEIDLEQCGSDLVSAQEVLTETELNLAALQEEIESITAGRTAIQSKHDALQDKLDSERIKLTGFDDEMKSLEHTVKAKNAQISNEGLERQKLAHQIEKLTKDKSTSVQTLTQLIKEHDWIEEEQSAFGKAGTPYDFHGQNISECKSSLATLTERFQGMKKKINPKVMNMIDSVEKKEVALKNMMRTVVRDKRKIEETIDSLDEYKKEALQKTWSKVNGDFGQIFADLLPGSFAKLDPLEGKSIAEGLEVKVSLGKVWKQSLTELSGGQRSLIALSLIMALLQFKPAPMYILDEVDAALDLSHTQNIGRLIKSRFKGSQFIVVSLKDGMFQNANRIFRTRFSEGTSVVQALTPADLR